MACPVKYRKLNSFYKYHSQQLQAPFPVICIGGNHEASNYFLELYHGGWVAPNFYYLGTTGSVLFGGLRISGLSGIFKAYHFDKGQYETCPMTKDSIYSAYHVRRYSVWKMSQLHGHSIDIMLSHEWPTCIWKYGNYKSLLKWKSHFGPDLLRNQLGNPALNHLLFQLQPKQWFAGHLHCKFSATVNHQDTGNVSRFLATDKFVANHRRRQFVQVLDFKVPDGVTKDPSTGFYKLEYDPVWLAIVRSTNPFLSVHSHPVPLPMKDTGNALNGQRWDYRPTKEEIEDIVQRFNGNLVIPQNFKETAAIAADPGDPRINHKGSPPEFVPNPQTLWLMEKLGINDKVTAKHEKLNVHKQRMEAVSGNGMPYMFGGGAFGKSNGDGKGNESENEQQVFQWTDSVQKKKNSEVVHNSMSLEDPNEIDIGDLDDDDEDDQDDVMQDPNEIDVDNGNEDQKSIFERMVQRGKSETEKSIDIAENAESDQLKDPNEIEIDDINCAADIVDANEIDVDEFSTEHPSVVNVDVEPPAKRLKCEEGGE